MRRRLGLVAAAAFALATLVTPARAQLEEPEHPVFGHTLLYGSGFINTPFAWVPKTTIFGTASTILPEDVTTDLAAFNRGTVGASFLGFLEGGVTILDLDGYAGYGKIQLMEQDGLFPALAAGGLNLTNLSDFGRYAVRDTFRADFDDRSSFFGVASWVTRPGGVDFPSWVVVSVGYGTGLFKERTPALDEGGETGGLFGALALDFQATEETYFRVAFEHDGFDSNIGATAWIRGLEIAFGVLSVDEGGTPEPLTEGEPPDPTREGVGFLYNQTKPYIAISLDLRSLAGWPWIWD